MVTSLGPATAGRADTVACMVPPGEQTRNNGAGKWAKWRRWREGKDTMQEVKRTETAGQISSDPETAQSCTR